MQKIELGMISELIIHFIGNKNNAAGADFSNAFVDLNNNIKNHICQLINNSFTFEEAYQFSFVSNIGLNPMHQFISSIFDDSKTFIEHSKNIGRYLYDKSIHPQIKNGELGLVYFTDCKIDGILVNCLGIFKSENKDTILKVSYTNEGYNLIEEAGISTHKLDKGCLIFNLEKESGYVVFVVDNVSKNAAKYWKDDFLNVTPKANGYQSTNQLLGLTKQFITKQLVDEFKISKPDQINLLNRSIDYFKNHKKFNKQEFEEEVFVESNIIESFHKLESANPYENIFEALDNFDISEQAVKKQQKRLKNILRLDKNFHIYIHGDRELIEQGIENDGRKYYKIYYEQEN